MYNVMLVDDEPMVKRTLSKLINQSPSFQVVSEAEDGAEALELINQQRHDIVFTDIRMPVMDGLELLKELKQNNPAMEIVMISGYDDFKYVQQALRLGSVDYLLKPIEPLMLEKTLKHLLALFDKKKESYRSHSDWLLYCQQIAERLAERLWQLQRADMKQTLQEFHLKLKASSPNLDFSKLMYSELLALLKEQMQQKGELGFSFEEVSSLETIYDMEGLLQATQKQLADMQHTLQIRSNWHNRNIMQIALQFMQEHYTDEHLSLQDLADHVGISASYFSRIFKEEFSISFIQYLTKLRMEEAASRLQTDPTCKTYEVAFSVGYSDYSHFAKVFKKHFSVSPSEYKKRYEIPSADKDT